MLWKIGSLHHNLHHKILVYTMNTSSIIVKHTLYKTLQDYCVTYNLKEISFCPMKAASKLVFQISFATRLWPTSPNSSHLKKLSSHHSTGKQQQWRKMRHVASTVQEELKGLGNFKCLYQGPGWMRDDSKIRPVWLEISGEKYKEGTGLRAEWWEVIISPGCWLLGRDTSRTIHIKERLWWEPVPTRSSWVNSTPTYFPPGWSYVSQAAQTFGQISLVCLGGCFCMTFELVEWIKQIALLKAGGPHPVSSRPEQNKKADFSESERTFLLPECLWGREKNQDPSSNWNVGSSCVLSMLPLRLNYSRGSPRSPAFWIDLGTYSFHNSVSHNSF